MHTNVRGRVESTANVAAPDGRIELDEILWKLTWPVSLCPRPDMIPARSVFLCARQGGYPLHAAVGGIPDFLRSYSLENQCSIEVVGVLPIPVEADVSCPSPMYRPHEEPVFEWLSALSDQIIEQGGTSSLSYPVGSND